MEQTVAEARRRICAKPKRVLLLPPDITRMHSGAGRLTEMLYQLVRRRGRRARHSHARPARAAHAGGKPADVRLDSERADSRPRLARRLRARRRDFRPASSTKPPTAPPIGRLPIVLNRMLMEEPWDLIINVGHVVPHEVLGFANHNKNYFIGLGGKDLICAAHMAAASCGIENNLGNLITPVRACFNRAEDDYLGKLPDLYVQVVLARNQHDQLVHTGVYVGDDLETYLDAARQSREQNITVFDEPVEKIVCVMQGDEFFSTWVANKAVYRTRMALADGGELVIIAPGLKRFGEQPEVDAFIRKYGYVGTPRVMEQYRDNADMQDLAHATAHLIHGSSEGRFKITYAPGHLTKDEIEGVNFATPISARRSHRYQPDECKQGWNTTADGERFYFIPTPSAGLWATQEKLFNRPSGFAE